MADKDGDDPKDLVEIGPIDIAEIVTNPERDDLDVRLRVIRDMSATAADAAKEVARYTYAVPAEEKTKQEKELTKRVGIEAACRLVFGSVLAIMASINLTGHPKTLGGVLIAIAGIFAGKEIVAAGKDLIEAIRKKMS